MSRIRNAWRALMGGGSDPAPDVEPACTSCSQVGPLFGLSPPDGCYFDVHCHRGESWFVDIRREGRGLITNGLSLIGERYNPGKTDEELIVMAAKEALEKFAVAESRAQLVGLYPPKRAKGAK